LKKKILIIGGTGFLGHKLAQKCLRNNFQVISLSRKKPKKERFLKNVKYLYADISNNKKLKNTLNFYPNYVVNFGGDVDHHGKNTLKSHYSGCKNLANILKEKKITKFIQIGSSVEYANTKSPHLERNVNVKIHQLKSIYAQAKLSSTNYLINLFEKEKFPIIIFRPYLIYGPGQDINRLIPFVIKNCLEDKNFPCSNGKQYRDFTYIDDAIDVIFKSLISKRGIGEIFNLCTGKPIRVKEIIRFIKKKIKKGNPKFGLIPLRKDEVTKFYGNPKKIRSFFNWKHKINIQKGLTQTIAFYENYFKKRSR
tara:strand:+ start:2075 stop:3001 length:927 start_codon:yes stop_codon:yes gene_type:complete